MLCVTGGSKWAQSSPGVRGSYGKQGHQMAGAVGWQGLGSALPCVPVRPKETARGVLSVNLPWQPFPPEFLGCWRWWGSAPLETLSWMWTQMCCGLDGVILRWTGWQSAADQSQKPIPGSTQRILRNDAYRARHLRANKAKRRVST